MLPYINKTKLLHIFVLMAAQQTWRPTKPTQQLVIVGWFGLKQLILFLISFGCCEPTT